MALVAVVAYTCIVMVCTETEKTEQAALLVALAHDDWALLERVAVVTTKKQVDYVEEYSTNSQHVSSKLVQSYAVSLTVNGD